MENLERINVIKQGERVKATFTAYTHEGLGIAKVDGVNELGEELTNYPIFVTGAIFGESGIVEIDKVLKTYATGTLTKFFNETKSPYRVKPICKNFGICGGCDIMHLSYEGQLDLKQRIVQDTFTKIGGFTDVEVKKVIGMDNDPLYYRNKVQVPCCNIKNKIYSGFYKKNSHLIVPLDECYIQSPLSTEIVNFTKNVLNEFGVIGYNEKNNHGDLKHIIIRKNNDESQIMIVLVVKRINFIKKEDEPKIVDKIIKRYKNVKTIVVNINPNQTNTILGAESNTIYGDGYIKDSLCGLTFNIGSKSFYQVNHEQCEKLYSTAIEMAELSNNDIAIDAYCGIGTIGMIAAKTASKVYSVEVVEEAIEMAKENAKENKIKNISFVCCKAEEQIVKWMKKDIKPNIIFVDPPRKGCDKKFIDTIIEMQIPKIVYVSCDVATLARDVRYLVDAGYSFDYVQPVDMFAQTSNVECVVCLERK